MWTDNLTNARKMSRGDDQACILLSSVIIQRRWSLSTSVTKKSTIFALVWSILLIQLNYGMFASKKSKHVNWKNGRDLYLFFYHLFKNRVLNCIGLENILWIFLSKMVIIHLWSVMYTQFCPGLNVIMKFTVFPSFRSFHKILQFLLCPFSSDLINFPSFRIFRNFRKIRSSRWHSPNLLFHCFLLTC